MIYKTFIKLQIAYYRFVLDSLINQSKRQLFKAISEDVKNKFYGEGIEKVKLDELIKQIDITMQKIIYLSDKIN